ncbi:hypothetical protein SAMN02745704_02489 [Paucidesulfovibrio gracilis DSM 16080]|uniref:Uncharacterized protein n=2 Tax=Paucidesulfovibrio TaxID=2910985 RepID=A0A1T4XWL5_9BACT|nr:hypothetical protein SAMN02745704_02489 [Paucidesulfovibrio gracilis DSM 16080]
MRKEKRQMRNRLVGGGAVAVVLFVLCTAASVPAQPGLGTSDPEAVNMVRLLCLKHDIKPEAACHALTAMATTPPMYLNTGQEGMLDALFDPDHEQTALRELAEQYDLPASALAAALYDYRVWDLARQGAGR